MKSPTPRDRADTIPGGSTALSPAAGAPVLRRIALGPLGAAAIGPEVRDQLEHEAARLGVTVSTIGSGSRQRRWTVRVRRDEALVALEGYDPLPEMLARGLRDFEARYEQPDDDDPGPSQMDREGLPEFNGAFR